MQGRIFSALRELETIRAKQPVFSADALFYGIDTGSIHVLGVCRERLGDRLIALFNFSETPQTLHLEDPAPMTDLVTGAPVEFSELELEPYGFVWALHHGA